MAISTGATFNPLQIDFLEEAFELAGLKMKTGNDVRTARRSLDYLTLSWANLGINLWTLEEKTIASSVISVGVSTYDIPLDTISILDAVIRTDDGSATLQTDLTISRISSTTYSQIPQKLQRGRPVQFVYSRIGIRDVTTGVDRASTVTLWPVPDASSKYTFVYWRMRRIAEASQHGDTTQEVPDRFFPALLYGLATNLAIKKNMSKYQVLKTEYAELLELAMGEDREKADLKIIPDLEFYGRNN